MNILRSTLLVAVAGMALTACSSDYDKDMGFLGTRDDIVISSKSEPVKLDKTPEVSIEKEIEDIEPVKEIVLEEEIEIARTANLVEPATREESVTQSTESISETLASPTVKEASLDTPPPPPGAADIPPNARPGECYGKVLIPAVTERMTERVQVAEEQKMLTRIIPAQYKIEREQVLVREGRKYWKQGTGPIQKVNELTGEILCLVEEPPVYKTVEKKVLVAPEKPEYKLVPAQFETVTKTKVIQPERIEWRRILCETNVTPSVVTRIQQALRSKGYNVGPVDGAFGGQTLAAINQYQLKNGLATRGVTYETLGHLGVSLAGKR